MTEYRDADECRYGRGSIEEMPTNFVRVEAERRGRNRVGHALLPGELVTIQSYRTASSKCSDWPELI
jgi:hypothetical protein